METERLIIDSIREADKEDYYINISHDKRVLETFICRYADTLEDFDYSSYPGRQDLFAIRLKETGRLIGIILYFDEKEDSCEIGYGIGSAFWNQGYATEVVGRFLEYLFREKGMRTVYASFFTGNDASRRVMEKCGMTFDHFSEKELTYLDVDRDLTYWETEYGWYLCLDGHRIIGGMGVIENDFHDRKDLTPNVCAVYTEEAYRGQGIAGRLLNMVVEDMCSKGISPLYLVTDHTGFYERYGWEFLCMVQGDGEPEMTRMYVHR